MCNGRCDPFDEILSAGIVSLESLFLLLLSTRLLIKLHQDSQDDGVYPSYPCTTSTTGTPRWEPSQAEHVDGILDPSGETVARDE